MQGVVYWNGMPSSLAYFMLQQIQWDKHQNQINYSGIHMIKVNIR